MNLSKRGDDKIVVWGSGESEAREFLHVDGYGCCLYPRHGYSISDQNMTQSPKNAATHLNVGTGVGLFYKTDFAVEYCKNCRFCKGELVFDASKPDGSPRKLLGRYTNKFSWLVA